MELCEYDPYKKRINSPKVTDIKSCTLYHVVTGRSAWHSTWIKRYCPGHMHTTFESAKKFCEIYRKRGTVFYIYQLPSIAFACSYGTLFATQINTDTPFYHYPVNIIRKYQTNLYIICESKDKFYLKSGISINDTAFSLCNNSKYWKNIQPKENSILLLWGTGCNNYMQSLGLTKLIYYKSVSHGKKYHLEWHENLSEIKPDYIIKIANSCNNIATNSWES